VGRLRWTAQRVGRSPTERRQRGSQPDERRIRQGIAQVAGEAVGHLARLFIHLAACIRAVSKNPNTAICQTLVKLLSDGVDDQNVRRKHAEKAIGLL